MDLTALLAATRALIDDTASSQLFSDTTLTGFLNNGIREAVNRGHPIRDASTSAIIDISIVSGTALYTLDSRVLRIIRAKISGKPVLGQVSFDRLNLIDAWDDHTAETPTHYCTDYETEKLLLYPSPTSNATLILTVERAPLADLAAGTDTPELPEEYHQALTYWAAYEAYKTHDADTEDGRRAAENLHLFGQIFGRVRSLRARQALYRTPPNSTIYERDFA